MIRCTGVFSQKSKTLRWTCPVCNEQEQRSAPYRIQVGSVLKTHCRESKKEIVVVCNRVIP